jgi:hypothetical protein
MTFQLEPYQLFLILAAIIGGIWAVGKTLWGQIERNLDSKFEGIAVAHDEAKKAHEKTNHLERQILELKADMPLNYVRREDYIRGQTVIEAKLDALASKLEIVQIQGAMKHDARPPQN